MKVLYFILFVLLSLLVKPCLWTPHESHNSFSNNLGKFNVMGEVFNVLHWWREDDFHPIYGRYKPDIGTGIRLILHQIILRLVCSLISIFIRSPYIGLSVQHPFQWRKRVLVILALADVIFFPLSLHSQPW